MDCFELRPGSGVGESVAGYWPVQIVINGEPLVDLVRRIEEPLVAEEVLRRRNDGETAEDLVGLAAGSYMYPTVHTILGAAHDLFGPIEKEFVLEPDDPQRGKTILLGCDCGIVGCWPFLARVTVGPEVVIWSDFAQFHRDWSYNLGPYRFDRAKYFDEFARLRAV